MKKSKTIRIGFDLDGVIIDKPPFIPKSILEWAIRNHSKRILSYRYPGRREQFIRMCIHYPTFRPSITENVHLVKKLSKQNQTTLYAITGRYGFLKKRTHQWLKKHQLTKVFKAIHLNERNQQPHKFKKITIEKLKLNIFIDDDKHIVNYLKERVRKTRIILFTKGNTNLKEIINR